MQTYVINFWRWWYGVKVPQAAQAVLNRFLFILQSTNTLAMARNLGKPLYQDDSGIGKLIGFMVRSIWVWIGGMLTLAATIPHTVVFIIYALLPIVTLYQCIVGAINVIMRIS